MKWVVVVRRGRRSIIYAPGGSPPNVPWNTAQRRARTARAAGFKGVRIRRFSDLIVGANTKRR